MIYNDTTRVCYISHLIAWQRNIVSVCALPKKKVWVNEMSWQTVLAAINGHNSVVRSDEELSKRHGIHLKWIRSNELVTVFSAVFKQINEANWNWNGMESNDPLLLISTLQYSHLISFHFNFTLQPTFYFHFHIFYVSALVVAVVMMIVVLRNENLYIFLCPWMRYTRKMSHDNNNKCMNINAMQCMTNENPRSTTDWKLPPSCVHCACLYVLSPWKTIHFICLGNEFQTFMSSMSFFCRHTAAQYKCHIWFESQQTDYFGTARGRNQKQIFRFENRQ